MNYLIPDYDNNIKPINNYSVYFAVKQSQKGGRTSVLHYGEFTDPVYDMDITSSYPN